MLRLNRSGFTVLELLVVIAIIAFAAGMITFLPKADRRSAVVKAAAEELAATLRQARSIAVDQRATCAVAFNIQNAPGTSGRVLNNHSGGHWYRIIGAGDGEGSVSGSTSTVINWASGSTNLCALLLRIRSAWIGDAHVLPQRQVRFLALTDQDNGSTGGSSSSTGNTTWYPASYPRPWFGWWDATGKRWYPWGGYDTAIKDKFNRPCSGFYFEGSDGTITGCLNPATTRYTTNTANGSPPITLLEAGKPRALVNAEWLDYTIAFNPDGSAYEPMPMRNRMQSYWWRGSATDTNNGGGTGYGDLGPYTSLPGQSSSVTDFSCLTTFLRHTGKMAITLAPDADADSDSFPTARAALDSIWPLFRVTVSGIGDIQVVQVKRSLPDGLALDASTIPDAAAWQNATTMNSYYWLREASNADASHTIRAKPVSDFLSPEILAARQWWATW